MRPNPAVNSDVPVKVFVLVDIVGGTPVTSFVRPRSSVLSLRLGDRLASAFLGAIFGGVYGLMLSVGVGYFTDGQFRMNLLWNTIAVFAALGLVLGPMVGEVIGSLFHFMFGVFAGLFSGSVGNAVDPEPRAGGLLRALFVIGLGTGLTIYWSWRYF